MTATHCPQGHPTPTSTYRDSRGYCLECKRENDRNLKTRQRAAYDVCRGLEKYGIRFENNGQPVSADEVAAQLLKVVKSD